MIFCRKSNKATNRQLPQLVKISKTKSDIFGVSGVELDGCRSPAFGAQAPGSFLALAACHKGEALEQVHVLFVLQQRAVQFRQCGGAGFQVLGRHVFCQQ